MSVGSGGVWLLCSGACCLGGVRGLSGGVWGCLGDVSGILWCLGTVRWCLGAVLDTFSDPGTQCPPTPGHTGIS